MSMSDVKIMLTKGAKGDAPEVTETPIDNGHRVTFSYPDGDDVSFDVHNATSGDYSGLTNKPSLNGVTINGSQTSEDFGIATMLTSTGDSTDRTAEIVAMLNAHGVCRLGEGDFYVQEVDMPSNSSIIGSGIGRTVIRLLPSDGVTETYAIKMTTRCSVYDVSLMGGSTDASVDENRHGFLWEGEYPDSLSSLPTRGMISNVWMYGFRGSAIICRSTSMGFNNCIHVCNAYISYCYVGINIPVYSEYHKFTSVTINRCAYGVINNGGNNCFVNCGLNGNTVGFVLDNTDLQAPNNGHGSMVGCNINHSGNNTGLGIKIIGATYGFVFDGCQIFASYVDIKNSAGINFANCNFGRDTHITINGGDANMIANSLFVNAPTLTITNTSKVKISNSYTYSGTAITA